MELQHNSPTSIKSCCPSCRMAQPTQTQSMFIRTRIRTQNAKLATPPCSSVNANVSANLNYHFLLWLSKKHFYNNCTLGDAISGLWCGVAIAVPFLIGLYGLYLDCRIFVVVVIVFFFFSSFFVLQHFYDQEK